MLNGLRRVRRRRGERPDTRFPVKRNVIRTDGGIAWGAITYKHV